MALKRYAFSYIPRTGVPFLPFIERGEISGRATRSSQMQNIPHFKSSSGQKTFYYRIVSIWNSWKAILKLLSQYLPLSSI